MSKHIKEFKDESEYQAFKESAEYAVPNLSWCREEDTIMSEAYFAPPVHDYSQDYFTIVSTSDNNIIRFRSSTSSLARTVSVSTNNGETWVQKTSSSGTNATILATLNSGGRLLIKGTNNQYATDTSKYNYFYTTGTFNVEGNSMSLIYGDNFQDKNNLNYSMNLLRLFDSSKVVDAGNLILPALYLSTYCYQQMFNNCTGLTTAPTLPAPDLSIHQDSYRAMFSGCRNLTYVKCLATNLGRNSTYATDSWLEYVSSTGTFVKDPSATSWKTGDSGIPAGWTVVDNDSE